MTLAGHSGGAEGAFRNDAEMVCKKETIMADVIQTNPPTMAPPGGHYSHAVTANGFVFVSGELPIAPDGTKLNDAPFEQQAQQVLDNVAHALKGAGSSIDKLTQVRVYVTDIAAWPAFNTLYAKWAGNARPARCVVPVPQLHYGFKIEIEAVAVK
jgi:reactive intermediate/imine deaminase